MDLSWLSQFMTRTNDRPLMTEQNSRLNSSRRQIFHDWTEVMTHDRRQDWAYSAHACQYLLPNKFVAPLPQIGAPALKQGNPQICWTAKFCHHICPLPPTLNFCTNKWLWQHFSTNLIAITTKMVTRIMPTRVTFSSPHSSPPFLSYFSKHETYIWAYSQLC